MIDIDGIARPAGWTLIASPQLSREGEMFISEGGDPQLVFALDPALAPGWYRLRVAMEGVISRPSLYLDCGTGMSEAGRQDLDLCATGIDSVVRVDGPLRHLRLDPVDRSARFRLDAIEFGSISPAEAVWRMWRALERVNHVAPMRPGECSSEQRAQLLWRQFRGQTTGVERLAYRAWRSGVSAVRPSAAPADDLDVRLSLVLLPGATSEALESAVSEIVESLAPDVEVIAPKAAVPRGSLQVRALSSTLDPIMPGLADARGRYVSWISADERISPGMWREVSGALEDELVDLLYTDEDFLGRSGEPELPYFKPAWDPDLQCQHDMVGPSSFYRVERLRALESVIRADGPAWAHLMPVRLAAREGSTVIRHLPIPCRHHLGRPGAPHSPLRRIAPTTSQVADALRRQLPEGAVDSVLDADTALPRLVYPIPDGVQCEIVIPTRDRVDLLSVCVESVLAKTRDVSYRVVIVDNGSVNDDTLAYLEQLGANPRVRILRDDSPFNYSALNNRAVSVSVADVVVLLNNDIEITDGAWLRELVAQACRPEIGAVGAKLLYPDGTLQHAGVVLGVDGVAAHAYPHASRAHPGQFGRALAAQQFSAVTAACLAVRRSVFEEVGGLDTGLAVAFNDVDLCLRIREAGYCNLWLPWVWMYHHESASRGFEDNPEKQARFEREVDTMRTRWSAALVSDPAYNPNLSLIGLAFSIDPDRHAPGVARTSRQAVRSQ